MDKLGNRVVLNGLKYILVNSSTYSSQQEKLIIECIEFSLRYLFTHPNDVETRTVVREILSLETSGHYGVSLLAFLCIRENVKEYTNGEKDHSIIPIEPEFLLQYLERFLKCTHVPIIIGIGKLPEFVISHPIEQIYISAYEMLNCFIKEYANDDKAYEALIQLLHFTILLSRECTNIDIDNELDLIKVVAGLLATYGDFQHARDLAEHILILSKMNDTPKRRRKAWLNYADIYAMCKDYTEALIGLACSKYGIEIVMDKEEVFQELYLEARIFRGIELREQAKSYAEHARSIAITLKRIKNNAIRRLDVFILGLKVEDILRHRDDCNEDITINDIEAITNDIIDISRIERENANEIMPVAVLIAQLLSINSSNDKLVKEFEEIRLTTKQEQQLVLDALANNSVNFKHIEALYNRLKKAVNREDIGYDIITLQKIARQMLDTDYKTININETLYLLEILMDNSISLLPIGSMTEARFEDDNRIKKIIESRINNKDVHSGTKKNTTLTL